jgi:hypothetical protein
MARETGRLCFRNFKKNLADSLQMQRRMIPDTISNCTSQVGEGNHSDCR